MQNPEEAVEFDTVPNVKKQHEVNVGKYQFPRTFLPTKLFLSLLIFVCTAMQVSQIPLDSEVTIRWLYLRHLSHKVLLASQILVRTTKVVLGISALNYHAFSLGADLLAGNVTNELSNEVHYILDNSMFI